MNQAERIFKIHNRLKEVGPPVCFEALQDMLFVSRATLKRDLAYMRYSMDAPLLYDRPRNGYYYDPDAPEFELPGLWFNSTELYALLASEQLFESVQPGLFRPYIGPLKARIRRLLERSGHRADTVTARILLQPLAACSVDNDQFATVAAAVLNARVLDIEYRDCERNKTTNRRVHPHRLLHYRETWYLVAWCERAQDLRTFSLDRISGALPTQQPFPPADEAALERKLSASFGIFFGKAEEWAVLRFGPRIARWVADEKWHPDQIGRWEGDEYEIQVPYSDRCELVMEILKYGPEVEVVAPESLRQTVGKRIREAASLYG